MDNRILKEIKYLDEGITSVRESEKVLAETVENLRELLEYEEKRLSRIRQGITDMVEKEKKLSSYINAANQVESEVFLKKLDTAAAFTLQDKDMPVNILKAVYMTEDSILASNSEAAVSIRHDIPLAFKNSFIVVNGIHWYKEVLGIENEKSVPDAVDLTEKAISLNKRDAAFAEMKLNDLKLKPINDKRIAVVLNGHEFYFRPKQLNLLKKVFKNSEMLNIGYDKRHGNASALTFYNNSCDVVLWPINSNL